MVPIDYRPRRTIAGMKLLSPYHRQLFIMKSFSVFSSAASRSRCITSCLSIRSSSLLPRAPSHVLQQKEQITRVIQSNLYSSDSSSHKDFSPKLKVVDGEEEALKMISVRITRKKLLSCFETALLSSNNQYISNF